MAFTILPRHPGEGRAVYFTPATRASTNQLILANAAALGIPVVDVAADSRIGCEGCNSDPTYFVADQTHLNDNGYRVVASLASPVIDSLLSVTYKLTANNTNGTAVATVDITVVQAGTSQTVPNVVGLNQAAGSQAITSAGLAPGFVSMASSATVPVNTIISQSPLASTRVTAGSPVAVVISSGPIAQIAVPDTAGQTQAAASSILQSAGLTIGTITRTSSPTVTLGNVVSESPYPGTTVNPGTAVNLLVSSGPSVIDSVSVSPNSGAGMMQTFVAIYNDSLGASALYRRLFLVGSGTNAMANQCYVQADASGIYLIDDSGTQLLGPVNGTANVSNSQCTLNGSGTSLNDVGTTSTLTVALSFHTVYLGSMNLYLSASDSFGNTAGWKPLGIYNVGPSQAAVPNVAGQTIAVATSWIQSAGLVVGTVSNSPSSSVVSGNVLSETPASGTVVSSGSAISLVVSSGLAQAAVPDVVGQTQVAASASLQMAGLVVGTVTTAASSAISPGSIISESPAAATHVPFGSAVNLIISAGPTKVGVPSIIGQTQTAAAATLQSAGLIAGSTTTSPSSTVPPGNVINQSPAAGTQVNSGTAVSLIVSTRPAQVQVPDVTGQPLTTAAAALQAAGLSQGVGSYSPSGFIPAGSVIAETPPAATMVNPGTPVNLTISSGPGQAPVPNVIGQTQAVAIAAIQSSGFIGGTITPAWSNTIPPGNVISENPAAGTQVNLGSTVNLVVSGGPSPIAAVSVSPSTGAGASQTFVAIYSHTAGATALSHRYFLVGTTATGMANKCYVQADLSGVYLFDDAGKQLMGPISGQGGISNSQCTLNASGTGVIDSGNTSTLTVNLAFQSGYTGAMNLYLSADDSSGNMTGWQTLGAFSVNPPGIAVPNVVGQSQSAAAASIQGLATGFALLQSGGLLLGTVTTASSSTVPSGYVISQSPAAGSQVPSGSPVNLIVSSGPIAPALSSISASSANAGTSVAVTLTGVNLVSGSIIKISGAGVSASNISWANATKITATFSVSASAVAGTYSVSVAGSSGATNSLPFLVSIPVPTFSSLTSATATAGTSIPVVITGTNFSPSSSLIVSGSGIAVSSVVFASSARLTAILTVDSGATPGIYGVSIIDAAGSSNVLPFVVTPAGPSAPTLTSMTPNIANRGTSVTVTLNGTNFISGAGVRLSGLGASVGNVVVISPTQLKVTFAFLITAAAGDHAVYVVTPGGNSSPLPITLN